MTSNMGSLDRRIRLMAAALMAYLFFTGVVIGIAGTIILVLAVVFATTSFIGFCPLYFPFGISTRKKIVPRDKNASIVDVRTRAEFQGGHVANSINIPLQELSDRLAEVKKLPQPLVLCCASGVRSSRATSILKSAGVDCQNGGSWTEVNASLHAV